MQGFVESATRLAGLAAVLLGWRPGEFWESTPAELGAVLGAMSGEPVGLCSAEVERLRALFPD